MSAVALDLDRLAAFARQEGLEFVALFGSRARGSARVGSDFDLACMPARWDALGGRLETGLALARAMERGDLDATWLPKASWVLSARVAREGQVLFERRPGAFRSFCAAAVFEAADSDIWRRRQLEGIRRILSKDRHVDRDLIQAKLGRLSEALDTVRPWLDVPVEVFTAEPMRLWACERALLLLVEHACAINAEAAASAGIPPSDYYSSFFSAASTGWIGNEVAEHLAPLVMLRNALVHAYERVDLATMHARLLSTLPWWEAYVRAIVERLAQP